MLPQPRAETSPAAQRGPDHGYHLPWPLPEHLLLDPEHLEAGRPQRSITPGIVLPIQLRGMERLTVDLDDQAKAPVLEVDPAHPTLAAQVDLACTS